MKLTLCRLFHVQPLTLQQYCIRYWHSSTVLLRILFWTKMSQWGQCWNFWQSLYCCLSKRKMVAGMALVTNVFAFQISSIVTSNCLLLLLFYLILTIATLNIMFVLFSLKMVECNLFQTKRSNFHSVTKSVKHWKTDITCSLELCNTVEQ